MDKVITKVKKVRFNWWEAFKEAVRLPGYHYYKPPAELKYRYPAPGSVPRTPEDKPFLFKKDWKQSFKDSPLNIRKKELRPDRMQVTEHYTVGVRKELDPNKEVDRNILMGPVRNRDRHPSPFSHFLEDDFHVNVDREEYGNKMREMFSKEPENRREFVDNVCSALGHGYDAEYNPQYLLFYERGATGIENEKRIQHMYLEFEHLLTEVLGRKRIETKEMDMYKGTVKKWQVLDDQQFSKDQIDKVQAAIKAPSSDELERYRDENQVKMKLPITNANVSDWRDKKRAIDSADFNSKLIEFERKRNENYFMKRYDRKKELTE
jgi:hypothetical protein